MELQEQLLDAAKKAMKIIAVAGLDNDFVFHIRDIIRKVEKEKCPSNSSEDSTSQA